MVTLQFWRGHDKECIISQAKQTTYKVVGLGSPLLSFVSDLEIDDICQTSFPHIYAEIEELRGNVNCCTAKVIQSYFKKIFDEKIRGLHWLGLREFEEIAADYGFEVPLHGIVKQNIGGKEVTCDTYRCFYVKGLTREIIEQLCIAELHYLVTSGYVIARCEHCGKLFMPLSWSEKYCTRRSEEYPTMNCKEVAKYKKRLAREEADETLRLYHKINTRLARRAKTAPPSKQKEESDALYRFRDEAAAWKERLKCDSSLKPQYVNWLNSFEKRK